MSDDLVKELKSAIRNLKLEILKKHEELDKLEEEYQELVGEEVEE